ncbi:MAG: hypothetical protein JKY53_00115 [Flavobacteriales bacterium]|nr:hypothetical protein [Flavobacteriales bacterium]
MNNSDKQIQSWKNVLTAMKVSCEMQGCNGCELKHGDGTCPAYWISAKISRNENKSDDDSFGIVRMY